MATNTNSRNGNLDLEVVTPLPPAPSGGTKTTTTTNENGTSPSSSPDSPINSQTQPPANNNNSLGSLEPEGQETGTGDTAPAAAGPTTTVAGTGAGDSAEPPSQRSTDFQKLLSYGLHEKVASKLDEVYKTGKLSHCDLDTRALDALKEFPVDGALMVLKQFTDSNLEHVSNKSAYLCGVMKTYRQKLRAQHHSHPKDPTTPNSTNPTNPTNLLAQSTPTKGPDETKIKAILSRTGYSLDVTTGQRKYFMCPPPSSPGCPEGQGEPDSETINPESPHSASVPGNGCEIFCGKIPKDLYEDELIPLFEDCGTIWDLRLMMDPMTGLNRGYAFITFTTKEGAAEAVTKLNDYEIRPGKKIGVTISYNNHRLFVGNIPKNRDRDEIYEEFSKHAPGLLSVIIYTTPEQSHKKNRGFCFLEYDSHKSASLAKRRLTSSRIKIFGCDIIVDWADPQDEPDDETMSKVRVLYVRGLNVDMSEERLKEVFEEGSGGGSLVERVKKIKDYAFIHFTTRAGAERALFEMNGKDVGGSIIEISLAKPPSDKKRKEEVLRARERRMMATLVHQRPALLPQLSHLGMAGMGLGLGMAGLGRLGGSGARGGGAGIRGNPLTRNDFAWPWLAAAGWSGGGDGMAGTHAHAHGGTHWGGGLHGRSAPGPGTNHSSNTSGLTAPRWADGGDHHHMWNGAGAGGGAWGGRGAGGLGGGSHGIPSWSSWNNSSRGGGTAQYNTGNSAWRGSDHHRGGGGGKKFSSNHQNKTQREQQQTN